MDLSDCSMVLKGISKVIYLVNSFYLAAWGDVCYCFGMLLRNV